MNWNVGSKIAAGFGLALAIFLMVGIASYEAVSELIRGADMRKQSYIVLDHLDEPRPVLREVELSSRNYFLTDDEVHLSRARAAIERMPRVLQQLRGVAAMAPRHQQRIERLAQLMDERLAFARETIDVYRKDGQKAAAQRIRSGRGQELNARIDAVIGEMQQDERTLLQQRSDAADANARNALATLVVGTASAFALALLAGYLITRNISKPLRELTACAERIAAGDTTIDMPAGSRSDEVGMLARAFAQMTEYLRGMAAAAERLAAGDLRSVVEPRSTQDVLGNAFARMIDSLRGQIGSLVEGANVLGAAAAQIVASTTQLASSASQSAAAVAETTTTVEEVRQTAELASQKARNVSETAQKSVQGAQQGRKSATDVGEGMKRIREQMDGIAAHMARLAEHGQTIGQIIATVEDLAAQSNLLAVNAAIEAAKAGEHGKGFGVVAQEVKSLAAQSRQATAEVRSILGEIQSATAAAVAATRQGGQAVEAGGRQTEQAAEAINALAASVNEAAQAATQIAASSQQQLVGVDQVASAMDNIRQASSQNMASARQLESAARNLSELGQRLKQIVAAYSV